MRLLNPQIRRDLDEARPLRIDIGSGPRPRPGFYALDQPELEGIDIVADLNQPLDLLPRPGAMIEFIVPHFSDPYAYSDPTHVRFFGLYTMSYFVDPEKQPHRHKVPAFYTAIRFEIESVYLAFYRFHLLDRLFVPLIRYAVNMSAWTQNAYERRLSWLFPAAEIRYRMRVCK